MKDSDFGRTPLSWAARHGHEAVVKLLVATGKVDVDAKDNFGQTPLSWAARHGHEAVVKLLVTTGKVDVDTKDSDLFGRTPLSWAAGNGHEAVVKLLVAIRRRVPARLHEVYAGGHVEIEPVAWSERGVVAGRAAGG